MSEFPEYDWIQSSIDATLEEIEQVNALNEKLKNGGNEKIGRQYYYFPYHMIKNPSAVFYVPLASSDPENSYSLETTLSEN